jgi:hypothetical protein
MNLESQAESLYFILVSLIRSVCMNIVSKKQDGTDRFIRGRERPCGSMGRPVLPPKARTVAWVIQARIISQG